MKDHKRTILKQLLNGTISAQKATNALKSNGKTTVNVWFETKPGLWERMQSCLSDSIEVLTREELDERHRDSDAKVIVIGGRNKQQSHA